MLLATTLSGEAAERFATTGYLAAIFAALTLALGKFFPSGGDERRTVAPPFPAFLGYSVGVVTFLSVVAILVSQPSAEVTAFIVGLALILMVVLVRCGTVTALNATLVRGGFLAAATRYAAVGVVAALALAAVFGGDADSIATFAFRLSVLATLAIAVSLLARTKAGLVVQNRYRQTMLEVDRLARAFFFERTKTYAAIVAAAALIVAGFLPPSHNEVFAVFAYAAAAAATFGLAMECRRLRS